MKKINEIFYSLQGEGYNTGRPAVFIRFSVCNLHCSFCDTDFTHLRPTDFSYLIFGLANSSCRLSLSQ